MSDAAPIIIKRKKVSGGDGHHGGAWKVAYADFVTAMMAFFLLMWLLNATTEQQRSGLADYFSPSIPIARVSGGGDGALDGNLSTSEASLAQKNGGMPMEGKSTGRSYGEEDAQELAALETVEDALMAVGGESAIADQLMRHVISRVTDEGLVIELFDLEDAHLFKGDQPTQLASDLAQVLGRVFSLVKNDIAVASHLASRPLAATDHDVWPLSMARADRFRRLIEDAGIADRRVVRATGHGDRKPAVRNPLALRNTRIEVVLLR